MKGFNLSEFSVRNRAITLFLIIIVVAMGAMAFQRLGRAEDPGFTLKFMLVQAAWPGATAEEMQEQVADKIEKRLQELKYFYRTETTVRPGFMTLQVQFIDTMPPDEVVAEFQQVRNKVTDEWPNMPRGVVGPFFIDDFTDVYFALYALQAHGMPHRQLVAEAEKLRQDYLNVEGVKKVKIIGEQAQKIFIEFSPRRLATLGVTVPQIMEALSAQNDLAPSGFVDTGGPRVFFRPGGAFDTLDKIKAVPIEADGKILRLSDVADVSRGYEDPPAYLIRYMGEETIILGIVIRENHNGLVLGEALDEKDAEIRASLPLGLELHRVNDQARYIEYAYEEFLMKFLIALGVVMAVSFITLGFRVGLVVAAAVPLTLAVVFVFMEMDGMNFDRITLGALILALGLLVDDAIIAIEMMLVKMEEGLDRIAAATYAWTSTAAPMLSGTLVTIIGFVPIGFANSTTAEFAGNIFWVVGYALLASWFVAVYFTPYLGVRLLPDIKPNPGGHDAIYSTPIYNRFRRVVQWMVGHKILVVATVVIAFFVSGWGMGFVKKQFFPSADRPELLVEIYLPQGTAFEVTDRVAKDVEGWLLEQPETETLSTYVGQGSPRFFLSLNQEQRNPAFAKVVVIAKDGEARKVLLRRVRDMAANGAWPEARVRPTLLLLGPPVVWPVSFRVFGDDPVQLRKYAERVRDEIAEEPWTIGTNIEWGERTYTMRLDFDLDQLSLVGLTPSAASQQLAALLNGATVTQVRGDLRTIDVVVRADEAERQSLSDIDSITLTTATGRSVPLSQVARLVPEAEQPVLIRRNREMFMNVRADIQPILEPIDASHYFAEKLAPLNDTFLPGYNVDLHGSTEESDKANAALAAMMPIMVSLMLFVIMFQVRSFAMMFMVFATAPLGLIGAVPALLILDQPFGFMAILGIIGLAGILMRNTLILVDQIRADKEAGLTDYEAIVESTVRRARPVILTALAAVLAFVPLTFSTFMGPMAVVLIGGVTMGTALTLLFLPALYALWFRVKKPQPSERPHYSGSEGGVPEGA